MQQKKRERERERGTKDEKCLTGEYWGRAFAELLLKTGTYEFRTVRHELVIYISIYIIPSN